MYCFFSSKPDDSCDTINEITSFKTKEATTLDLINIKIKYICRLTKNQPKPLY